MKNGVLLNFTRSHISRDRVRSGYEIIKYVFSSFPSFVLSLQILPVVVEIVLVLPLVTFPLVYFINGEKDEDKMWVAIGVLLFFIMLLVLVFISVLNTGKKNPGTMEKLTRYDQ